MKRITCRFIIALFLFIFPVFIFNAVAESVNTSVTVDPASVPPPAVDVQGGGGSFRPRDRSAPMILKLEIKAVLMKSFRITFDTDENALAALEYRLIDSDVIQKIEGVVYSNSHTFDAVGLLPNTIYQFRPVATDLSGNRIAGDWINVTTLGLPDFTPPSNVLLFQATSVMGGIRLKWKIPPDSDFEKVHIERSTAGFSPKPNHYDVIYKGSDSVFLDKNVDIGITYFYTAFSLDRSGNTSSGAAALTTFVFVSPLMPSDVSEDKPSEKFPPPSSEGDDSEETADEVSSGSPFDLLPHKLPPLTVPKPSSESVAEEDTKIPLSEKTVAQGHFIKVPIKSLIDSSVDFVNTVANTTVTDIVTIQETVHEKSTFYQPVQFCRDRIVADREGDTQVVELTGEDGHITLKPGEAATVLAEIPSRSTVTASKKWDCIIAPPIVRDKSVIKKMPEETESIPGGFYHLQPETVATVIGIGSPIAPLTFSKPVIINAPVNLVDDAVVEVYSSQDGVLWEKITSDIPLLVKNHSVAFEVTHFTLFSIVPTGELFILAGKSRPQIPILKEMPDPLLPQVYLTDITSGIDIVRVEEGRFHQLPARLTSVFIPQERFTKPVQQILLSFQHSVYNFALQSDSSVYQSEVTPPSKPGEYLGGIRVYYTDGTQMDLTFILIIEPFGFVFEKFQSQRRALRGAKLTLYEWQEDKKVIWPASEYRQINPMTTQAQGEYGFFVPPGTYQLFVEKDQYSSKEIPPLKISGNIINPDITFSPPSVFTKAAKLIPYPKNPFIFYIIAGLLLLIIILLIFLFRDSEPR